MEIPPARCSCQRSRQRREWS